MRRAPEGAFGTVLADLPPEARMAGLAGSRDLLAFPAMRTPAADTGRRRLREEVLDALGGAPGPHRAA